MAETEQVGGAGMQRAGQTGAAVGGPAEKALATASAMRERLMAMPAGKRTWLIASAVFLAAMCAGMIWFVGRPDWRVLFSGLDGKDVQQVSQELAAAGIPYETTVDGAGVQVPAEMLDKARMEVAAKGMQWGCPVLTTEGFSPEAMALVMPRVFAERFGLLPLRVAGSRILYLGFTDRLDASAAFAIEQMTELKVESGVVEGAQFEAARSRLLACDGVETKLEDLEEKGALAARITAILEQKQPIASRLVRLHQYYWLRMWLESGAFGKAGSLPATSEDVKDHVFAVGT
jgi:Secretory protein of YscJ/FliF family/Type II secretion system (T2SS), protein E, N-terminal domain